MEPPASEIAGCEVGPRQAPPAFSQQLPSVSSSPGDSVLRGEVSTAATELANIGTDDLRVSTEKKAADFMVLANSYFKQADDFDASEAFLEIVPFTPAKRWN